ncbi:MAG: signal peptidase II [Acidimicrobiales bacterium]
MTAAPVTGTRNHKIGLVAAIAALVIAIDQITKSLAVAHLSPPHGRVHLLGPFYLALSYNSGVAFSLGVGFTVPIVIVVVCLVAAIAWFARGAVTTSSAVAFGMILGGALGNLSDRLFRGNHGSVVDFIYSGFWPTFNVADASIVVGCILVAISYWRSSRIPARAQGTTDE